jgi:hypothetical protein
MKPGNPGCDPEAYGANSTGGGPPEDKRADWNVHTRRSLHRERLFYAHTEAMG